MHTLYLHFLDRLANSSLNSLTLKESYRHIGLAFNADLLFNLSFDSAILKNLSHWLGLQTLVKGVSVSADAVPLSDIVITASHRGPQDLLFAVPLYLRFSWLPPPVWPSSPPFLALGSFCLVS